MVNQVSPTEPLLEVKELKKYFPIRRGFFKRIVGYVKAVDNISFYINEGETLGLVGESGCGKTTAGRSILRAISPTSGEVLFRDPHLGKINLPELNDHELKLVRRNMRMIFQDPYASLNPRMTLLEIVGAPLLALNLEHGKALEDRVAELLKRVGMRPEYMRRYPHAFSGGQRQRIGLARALAPNPKFLVCDEPVSALDVSVQAQILNLLQDLQGDLGLTYLFVAHDLSVVAHISDRVCVMYVGKMVEMAPTHVLFTSPKHPYTEALMSAIPRPDPRPREKRILLSGEVANPANPPSGCYFHPRCTYVKDICKTEEPSFGEISPGHFVKCHRAAELSLAGALDLVSGK
jgi:peptide/nickel transport system ATP-binding protein